MRCISHIFHPIRLLLLSTLYCIIAPLSAQKATYGQTYADQLLGDTTAIFSWLPDNSVQQYVLPLGGIYRGERLVNLLYFPTPFSNKMVAKYAQARILPEGDKQRTTLHLRAFGEHLQPVRISLTALNAQEEVINQRSLDCVLTKEVQDFPLEINAQGAKLLRMEIYFEGIPGTKNSAYIFPIQLQINGHSVRLDSVPEVARIPIQQSTPLKNQILPSNFYTSPGSIIALGESVHYNDNLTTFLLNNGLQLIKQRQARLALIETTMSNALCYQRYIHTSKYNLPHSIDAPLKAFLDSLRRFNATLPREQQVEIAGITYNYLSSDIQSPLFTIFQFIQSLPNWQQQDFLHPLMIALGERNTAAALQEAQQHRCELEQLLSPFTAHCLERILQIAADRSGRIDNRDSVMAANSLWCMHELGVPTTFLYAHAGHVAKSALTPITQTTSMGQYLSQELGDHYVPLFVTYGEGDSSVTRDNLCSRPHLFSPPEDSFEGQALHTAASALYVPLTTAFNCITKIRIRGSSYQSHGFYPQNLYRRFHGALFLRTVTAPPRKVQNQQERSRELQQEKDNREALVQLLKQQN